MKVDGLSEQLARGFDNLGTALATVTTHVVAKLIEGDKSALEISKGVAALNKALEDQKERGSIDDEALSKLITKIIEEKMLDMGKGLCEHLKESLGNVLAESHTSDVSDGEQPSSDDKLDALLVMVKGIQEKIDSFSSDFKNFVDISLDHYSTISKERNTMPPSFLLLPDIVVALDAKASRIDEMVNFGKRLKNKVVKLGWDKVKVVFFCPVTFQMVECGPYYLVSASKELQRAASVLKWGHLLIKLVHCS